MQRANTSSFLTFSDNLLWYKIYKPNCFLKLCLQKFQADNVSAGQAKQIGTPEMKIYQRSMLRAQSHNILTPFLAKYKNEAGNTSYFSETKS